MRKTISLLLLAALAACSPKPVPIGTTEGSKPPKTPPKTEAAVSEKPVWAPNPENHPYKPSQSLPMDLIHTELDVRFDWSKQYLYGKAELTMKPYFYPQDSVVIDAKGFDIKQIALKEGTKLTELTYRYDSLQLFIRLPRAYTRTETLVLYFDYVSRPEELPEGGSAAITSDKGLYFINPLGEDPDKPMQIWTQGEPQASSCWFPTIDTPNEKTTQGLKMTVQQKYTTLSNGALVYSRENVDGTRTDYWRMEKPHAPYLFMMAVGEFATVCDKWRSIDVCYLVEKEYEPYARDIFGNTPEMLEFFSTKLNYEYAWPKYSQIVIRDYVSGAMENTSATTFLEQIQMTPRELLDDDLEYIIAHELFHHWFGDLITCESWANLAMNESFANYSEYLWMEHKYGRDRADAHAQSELDQYLEEAQSKREPIVRYHHGVPDDMFDRHSYNKGGRVLHSLRKLVGDEAFFAALNKVLVDNQFKPVEIAHLRLAFEEVTGQDLHWFFNQWFLSPGHPDLVVTDSYENGQVTLTVEQVQDTVYQPIFRLPLQVEIWTGQTKRRFPIDITKTKETFEFPVSARPSLVLFDAEQQVLGTVEHEKTNEELVFQYLNSDKYLARYEALVSAYAPQMREVKVGEQTILVPGERSPEEERGLRELLLAGLEDPYYELRQLAAEQAAEIFGEDVAFNGPLRQVAERDPKSLVRAAALNYFAARSNASEFLDLFNEGLNDSSYAVVAASIDGLIAVEPDDLTERLTTYEELENATIALSLGTYYVKAKVPGKYDWFTRQMKTLGPGDLFEFTDPFASYVVTLAGQPAQQQGIDLLLDYAENHAVYYVRFAAYKALYKLRTVEGVKDQRARIKAGEQHPILQRAYERID